MRRQRQGASRQSRRLLPMEPASTCTIEARPFIVRIVKIALESENGRFRLAEAEELLIDGLERGSFNSERAVELFSFAINNAVWEHVKNLPRHRKTYQDYKISGEGSDVSYQLAHEFIERTGAENQRPARQWLRFLLGA